GTPAEVAQALIPHMPETDLGKLIAVLNQEAEAAPQIETVPLGAFLDGLRAKGLRLGVCTNDGEAPARAHLDAAGVTERFDFICGFDSGHGSKPAPDPLLAFSSAMGLVPGRVVMVCDST